MRFAYLKTIAKKKESKRNFKNPERFNLGAFGKTKFLKDCEHKNQITVFIKKMKKYFISDHNKCLRCGKILKAKEVTNV